MCVCVCVRMHGFLRVVILSHNIGCMSVLEGTNCIWITPLHNDLNVHCTAICSNVQTKLIAVVVVFSALLTNHAISLSHG